MEPSRSQGGRGEVLSVPRLFGTWGGPILFDTTSDTTQSATPRNVGQPLAKKSANLSQFCNIRQRLETGVGGLWLRRARVRVPSVTLAGCLDGQFNAAVCGNRKGRLPGGIEDDHRDLSFGPLLVAGVALVNRGDLGPELGSLLFSGYAGDHGASQACDRDAYLWVGPEV